MYTVQPVATGGPQSAADRKLFDSLAGSFARAKRAVVLVGAGISTNAGIPVSSGQTDGAGEPPSLLIALPGRCRTFARQALASTLVAVEPRLQQQQQPRCLRAARSVP